MNLLGFILVVGKMCGSLESGESGFGEYPHPDGGIVLVAVVAV